MTVVDRVLFAITVVLLCASAFCLYKAAEAYGDAMDCRGRCEAHGYVHSVFDHSGQCACVDVVTLEAQP